MKFTKEQEEQKEQFFKEHGYTIEEYRYFTSLKTDMNCETCKYIDHKNKKDYCSFYKEVIRSLPIDIDCWNCKEYVKARGCFTEEQEAQFLEKYGHTIAEDRFFAHSDGFDPKCLKE